MLLTRGGQHCSFCRSPCSPQCTGKLVPASGGECRRGSPVKGRTKYCDKNCLPDDNKVIAPANDFAAHHKEFMPSPVNVQSFATYIDANKLDPRERKSYEKAYKDRKKEGQLELYSK